MKERLEVWEYYFTMYVLYLAFLFFYHLIVIYHSYRIYILIPTQWLAKKMSPVLIEN